MPQNTKPIRPRTRSQKGIETEQNKDPQIENKPKKQIENQVKMDQHKIQVAIKDFIPEFSGETKLENTENLNRFIGMADVLYNTLTAEEKLAFDKLIKYRLTGEAYSRICDAQINNYTELKNMLNNMYCKTQTLEQLERNYKNIRQAYGETIRNYGYRLNEAAIKYKIGYKKKYKLAELDVSYNNHIENNLIQIFKFGLNNTILREKIATNEAQNIDKIINETEVIEHMLSIATEKPNTKNTNSQSNITTCSFCTKIGHTRDNCRSRMYQERNNRISQPQRQTYPPQNYRNNKSQDFRNNSFQNYRNNSSQDFRNNSFQGYRNPSQDFKNYPPQNYRNNPSQDHRNNSFQNYNQYQTRTQNPLPQQPTYNRPNDYPNKPPLKYCSYCKVTVGHTFDECRSKFQNNNPNQAREQRNQTSQPKINELAQTFNGMRINTIFPKSETQNESQRQNEHQGNDTGSNQH